MRHNYRVKCLGVAILLSFIFYLSTVTAQESINATGSKALGSGGSVNYSVGQIAYQAHTGTTGTVLEGVQQSYEISETTGIEEANAINLSVTAYPNPTTEYFTLSIKEFELSNISYKLYDMHGNLLQCKKISSDQIQININELVSTTYFIKVIQNNKEIKTFKIIKTQ